MNILGRFLAKKKRYQPVEPDEILIDAANLPNFDTARLEGRIERPIGDKTFRNFLVLLSVIGLVAGGQLINLQIVRYGALSARAEENRLSHTTIIAERGLIRDRHGEALAENVQSDAGGIATRRYLLGSAASHVIGYVSYPKKDENGFWYQDQPKGIVGLEELHNDSLAGQNGITIAETDATGAVVSGSTVREPASGNDFISSLDAGIQKEFYTALKVRSEESRWQGGAGALMDIETGELIALASYPSFDPELLSEGGSGEAVAELIANPRSPFLDRAISGLYTPGSVVKPFVAVAALEEGIINPEKEILSTGSISVPNPYFPDKPSIFRDWKAHGWVDMRHALAVSSDVYFYEIGGGFEDQPGLGIAAIERYLRLFGFAAPTDIPLSGEEIGVIPNPEWKAKTFDGEQWFLGDTYNTAIGQYGFQTTLIQLVQGVSAVANGGTLVTPVMEAHTQGEKKYLGLDSAHLAIVREGMRLAVTEGTAQALAVPGMQVSGKTGTAEIGVRKEFTNSLVIGFFPFEHPRYAFAVVMERARAGTLQGAPAVMGEVLRWIAENKPEMFE